MKYITLMIMLAVTAMAYDKVTLMAGAKQSLDAGTMYTTFGIRHHWLSGINSDVVGGLPQH